MPVPQLTDSEQARLDATIRAAEQACRSEISIYLGAVDGDVRDFATSLHNTLVLPSRSILVLVDTDRRVIEIVTGGQVRTRLSDDEVTSIVAEMAATFAKGDLAGGLTVGVESLGKAASN